jgi:S-adenosylmethionine-dependent methyltransferase
VGIRTLTRDTLLQFDLATVPRRCKQRFADLHGESEDALRQCLVEHYYLAKGKPDPRTSPELKEDFDDAMYGTVVRNRATVIPWLNSLRTLEGMRVLEVGTGAGGSIIPLAEQGAHVTGIDIDRESLTVAESRCRIYGLADRSELHLANATDLVTEFPGRRFDAVIFFASLEHMTLEERCQSLPQAWELLASGGWLVVVETPNRLWWYDSHTSSLAFYNWLPDELAFRYRGHSRRLELNNLMPQGGQELLSLVRLGRGASYHEFQIALPQLELGRVDSCMRIWQRRRNPLRRLYWEISGDAAFSRFLRRAVPGVHPAFFQPYLDIAFVRRS